MWKHLRKRPSPGTIMGALALFISLSGTTYAATGGNFILGQPNSATSETSLTSSHTTSPTLNLVNTGGRPAARFQANAGKAVFTVSNSQRIPNLNSDLLDGLDSGSFVQGAAARTMYIRRTVAVNGPRVTLLTLPGFVSLEGECLGTFGGSAQVVLHNLSSTPYDVGSPIGYTEDLDGGSSVVMGPSIDSNGEMRTLQVGQTYRLTPGGFPRTRMVTFFLSADYGDPCKFQAQALAQGF